MHITSWRNVNVVKQSSINKERHWLTLTLLGFEVRSRSYDTFQFFCIKKRKQPEMLVHLGQLHTGNVNICQDSTLLEITCHG